MGKYRAIHDASIRDPEGFWLKAADAITWDKVPTQALDRSNAPFYQWFPDGRLNTCFNALDRHVIAGRARHSALIFDSPVTGKTYSWSYAELLERVARFAGLLRDAGVETGDRVVIYMPMIPEAVVAMLACARLGAVHSVVFGGFAPNELAMRIDDACPKVVVTASCGIEISRVIEYKPLVDRALELAHHSPSTCIVLQRPEAKARIKDRDLDWEAEVAGASPADCVPVAATDPLYILYTSGTTGKPKGVVRDNGGHAVAMCWSMANVYGAGPDDVFWAASDIGWVVGHSYIVYGPLLAGCTSVLYEGKPVGTPDAGAFWRVVDDHAVNILFTAPTALRAIRKADPKGDFVRGSRRTSLRQLFLAGERLDPDTYHWAREVLDIPVIDHWWQTETGWPIAANPVGIEELPVKPGSPTVPVPGYDTHILDDDGKEMLDGRDGVIAIRLPLPPGTLPTLWNDDDGFRSTYLSQYPGYYMTGDGGRIDEDGYLFVMGRIDDVINVAGHRLSTGAMEEILARHPAVAECAVIGVADEVKGQVPQGFVVLKANVEVDEPDLINELVGMVRAEIGPVAAFRRAAIVSALPKTRSGKVLRKTMRAIAEGVDAPIPSTIEDPSVLEGLRPILRPALDP